jgi:hypothetical protein
MIMRKQQGAALLLLVITLIMSGTLFVITNYSIDRGRLNSEAKTTQALSEAKQALLSFAVSFYDLNNINRPGSYGFLPCPEDQTGTTNSEGIAQGNCGPVSDVNRIGRLPWKTLGINPLKDAAGECLWYAVSGAFKSLPETGMLNEDTPGMFILRDENDNILKGAAPESRVVAVIIAPGAKLSNQNRPAVPTVDPPLPCAYRRTTVFNSAAQFLDSINGINNSNVSANVDSIDEFVTLVSSADNTSLNDRIITITQAEIYAAINQQRNRANPNIPNPANSLFTGRINNLTEALARCVANYGNPLPWAAPINLGADLRFDASYIDNPGALFFGRFPLNINNYNAATTHINDMFFDCGGVQVTNDLTNPVVQLNPAINIITSEYRRLWQHWKDHLFYAVSSAYTPGGTGACTPATCYRSGVTGIDYAAFVFYSGSPDINFNQLRRAVPPELAGTVNAVDNKNDVNNYIESIPAPAGSGIYSRAGNTDIIYCIDEAMVVSLCAL